MMAGRRSERVRKEPSRGRRAPKQVTQVVQSNSATLEDLKLSSNAEENNALLEEETKALLEEEVEETKAPPQMEESELSEESEVEQKVQQEELKEDSEKKQVTQKTTNRSKRR